jgi:hypothetical protein
MADYFFKKYSRENMKLYVDVLNYVKYFYTKCPSNVLQLKSGMKKISEFAQKIKSISSDPLIFLDGNKISDKEITKYFARKRKKRIVPYGIDMIVSKAFISQNLKVIYSLQEDADVFLLGKSLETTDSVILSKDLYFRNQKTLDFDFISKEFVQNNYEKSDNPTHITASPSVFYYSSGESVKFRKIMVLNELIVDQENALKDLRQALYYKLNIDKVLEISECNQVYNYKNCKYLKEVNDPILALQVFYPGLEMVGEEEEFIGFSMVLEICSWAKDGGKSFYDFLCRYYPWFSRNLSRKKT